VVLGVAGLVVAWTVTTASVNQVGRVHPALPAPMQWDLGHALRVTLVPATPSTALLVRARAARASRVPSRQVAHRTRAPRARPARRARPATAVAPRRSAQRVITRQVAAARALCVAVTPSIVLLVRARAARAPRAPTRQVARRARALRARPARRARDVVATAL
jgi:hypothetical protein